MFEMRLIEAGPPRLFGGVRSKNFRQSRNNLLPHNQHRGRDKENHARLFLPACDSSGEDHGVLGHGV